MMKEISRTTWIIAIGAFIVLTFLIAMITKTVQTVTHKEEIAVEINSEQIDTGIRLDKESKEANTFTSYKTVPSTNLEAIDVPMYQWATEQEKLFYEEMKTTEEMLGESFVAHFDLQSEIIKINDDLFTIEMKITQAVDQVNEYTIVKTFFIDLQKEKMIRMADVFDQSVLSASERLQLIQTQLADEELDEDDWQETLENIEDLNIALHPEEVIFYFNDTDIRDNNNVLDVHVDMVDMADYFNKDYYSIFITEEMKAKIEQMKIEEEEARQEAIKNHKYIALTFDDGPELDSTDRILDTLNEYDAKATFFMLGKNAQTYPDIAKRVAEEGHEIANHTITHTNLNAIGRDGIQKEVTDSLQQIEDATGVRPTTFRPPYGIYNDTVVEYTKATNQKIIMWSIDTLDWQHRNANTTYQKIVNQVRPGSIILMHDIHRTTADALPQIMKHLSNEGYEFATVSELLPYIEGQGVGPYFGN